MLANVGLGSTSNTSEETIASLLQTLNSLSVLQSSYPDNFDILTAANVASAALNNLITALSTILLS